jgi:CrcB protein
MEKLIAVCIGGALGSGARYLVSGWVARAFPSAFPWGTMTVNALGSFLLAFLMVVGLTTESLSPTWRIALTTGAMGGFTTYSTFNYETTELVREGATALAIANVFGTIVVCLFFGILGVAAARLLTGR